MSGVTLFLSDFCSRTGILFHVISLQYTYALELMGELYDIV